MLFNMPRTPFTRAQRIAALDWARKLGASNVPTIDSFEEYEQGFGNQGMSTIGLFSNSVYPRMQKALPAVNPRCVV